MQTYLNERIEEVLAGSSEPIVVRIYGPDLGVLRAKADEVHDALRGINGVVDLHTELQTDIPHIQVKLDLAKARRYGLKPGDMRRESATLAGGEEVGDIYRDGKAYDMHVWSIPDTPGAAWQTSAEPPASILPAAGTCGSRMSPTSKSCRPRTRSSASSESRRIDVPWGLKGEASATVVNEVEDRLAKVSSRTSITPR